ncbi:hypothetical protein FEM48_Zijuj04G0075400 [Ziziphus jujuba var. spinosa]|uniref:F-box domain-containing protein n=1 Tax=Ziziphus jujuba var. spinosa TaxID=714518 RepID=A0A978VIL5_ZIZJJ|nr:hypothetical protein FEM48_Zijuj04G0075400 [Ziziphus jujuba var. spinosa]
MVAKFFHFTKLVMEERLQLGCSSEEDRGYNVNQSSKKKKKEEEKTIGDGPISYLPESLILAIISFLSMEDTTRFGFASKKFFSVCKSIPVLDFSYFSIKKNSNISDPTQMSSFFLDFVAKSLELRNTSDNYDTCFQRLSFFGPITDDLFSKMFHCKPAVKEKDVSYCASSLIKCWWHFLVEVEMVNFGDSYDRSNQ